MTVIKIAKTPHTAFDPERPASKLLRAQIEHLEHATQVAPRKTKRLTEAEAAAYISQLTARLLAPQTPDTSAAHAVPLKKPKGRKKQQRTTKRARPRKRVAAKRRSR